MAHLAEGRARPQPCEGQQLGQRPPLPVLVGEREAHLELAVDDKAEGRVRQLECREIGALVAGGGGSGQRAPPARLLVRGAPPGEGAPVARLEEHHARLRLDLVRVRVRVRVRVKG